MANRATYRRINDGFSDELAAAVGRKFNTVVETSFDIIEQKRITRPVGKKRLSKSEVDFIAGFEAGYYQAAQLAAGKSTDG